MRKLTLLFLFTLAILNGCQKTAPIIQENTIHDVANTQENEVNSKENFQATVAHIICKYYSTDVVSMGSGIIIQPDGIIITNAHVIPHDGANLLTPPEGCIITLPDAETGLLLDNVYMATPRVIKDLGDKFDLATLKITGVESLKKQKKLAHLPEKFPAFNLEKGCLIDDVNLKDKIYIYGYPDVGSDNLSLVVTDGIVSSFPGDGTILTNAKINEGNSGGLAVNEKGCFIGIPSSGYQGTMESYGYIISTDLIKDFLIKAEENSNILKPFEPNSKEIKSEKNEDSSSHNNYEHPAYIKIVSSDIIENNKGQLRFVLNGNISNNCTQIEVRVVNKDRHINDSHKLKEWRPGDTEFVYRMAPDLGNIGIGYNEVTMIATCEGGQTPKDFIEIPFGV